MRLQSRDRRLAQTPRKFTAAVCRASLPRQFARFPKKSKNPTMTLHVTVILICLVPDESRHRTTRRPSHQPAQCPAKQTSRSAYSATNSAPLPRAQSPRIQQTTTNNAPPPPPRAGPRHPLSQYAPPFKPRHLRLRKPDHHVRSHAVPLVGGGDAASLFASPPSCASRMRKMNRKT